MVEDFKSTMYTRKGKKSKTLRRPQSGCRQVFTGYCHVPHFQWIFKKHELYKARHELRGIDPDRAFQATQGKNAEKLFVRLGAFVGSWIEPGRASQAVQDSQIWQPDGASHGEQARAVQLQLCISEALSGHLQ